MSALVAGAGQEQRAAFADILLCRGRLAVGVLCRGRLAVGMLCRGRLAVGYHVLCRGRLAVGVLRGLKLRVTRVMPPKLVNGGVCNRPDEA